MIRWDVRTAERRTTYCPVALDLRDDFSGGGALSSPRFEVERRDGTRWLPVDLPPTRTSGGVFAWPGLGRSVDPLAFPVAKIRVRIALDKQVPLYRATDDALEFDVPAYNDTLPPLASPIMPQIVLLVPGPAYPFSAAVRVLRGRVLDPGGNPVADAVIGASGVERAMSDSAGSFSLPLRWQPATGPCQIDVSHPRSGRAALVSAALPGSLGSSFDITVT